MASQQNYPVRIYGSDSLVSKVSKFQKLAEEHKEKQMINPFSDWEGASHRSRLDKDDPRYGRPVEGSKTEGRGIKAGEMISNEIRVLCEMIWEHGKQNYDGTACITFKELFELYTVISNKVVGVLLRARKHGLVDFKGEMLFQRRDDAILITLVKPIDDINKLFKRE
ncbi:actin-binding Rho-activating protein-like isoform X2 [Tachypleus tridentatus]